MTKFLKVLTALIFALPLFAQAQDQRTFSEPALDQMLAPIALYPDALLSQILMAATYPGELFEAARWSRGNLRLKGDDAVRAVQDEDWDPSVKSLVAFPQILERMDEKPEWTRSLGDAFLAQESQVMDAVQHLRRRADAAGNLQSSEQMQVQQEGPTISIRLASPQYAYVPYYDPMLVYGSWWWPAYQPVAWAPWPGYARPYRSSIGFWWGAPVGLSVNFFFGNFDWHQRHVRVVYPTAYYYRQPVIVNRTVVVDGGRWQHDPRRRESMAGQRTVQARPQIQAQPQAIRQVQAQVQARPAAPVQVQARTAPQAQSPAQPPARTLPVVDRREQRHEALAQPSARMPAAVAPQQPRAERQERREERRDERLEQRQERGQKG
jgi:hypothetical protein